MKPLLVLFISFSLSILISKLFFSKSNIFLSGKIAFAIMFIFTAIGHFIFTNGMSKMVPNFIPNKTFIVYATGIIEIIFAIGLLIPKYQKHAAIAIVIFLLLMTPANIKAASNSLNYQTGEQNGNGINYLWFRVPLQIFFILWVLFFTFKKN
jgi:uncharacterized membrane protein